MPIPLLIPAGLAAVGGVAGLLGSLKRKPVRSSFDPRMAYRGAQESAFNEANSAAANIGLQAGPRLYAQGLGNSGLGTSLISRAQQGAYESATSHLPSLLAQLQERRSMLDDQYTQDKRNWEGDIWSDVGRTAGGVGGLLMGMRGQQQAVQGYGDIESEIARLYGGASGGEAQGPQMRPTSQLYPMPNGSSVQGLLALLRRRRGQGQAGGFNYAAPTEGYGMGRMSY